MKNLISDYEKSVNAIIDAFKKKQGYTSNDVGYWIGDQVGEIYDFGIVYTFDFRDILTDIKESAKPDEIFKWREYMLRIWEINNIVGHNLLNEINYRSWLKGCPRLSDEELDKAKNKWKGFVDEISELAKATRENNESPNE